MPSELIFTGSRGLNTKIDPVRLTPGENRVAMLSEAVNVAVDASGRITAAPGYQKIVEGVFHSLWGDGGYVLAVKDGWLVSIQHDNPTGITQLKEMSDPEAQVKYALFFDRVVFTNGHDRGIVYGDQVLDWDVGVPDDPIAARRVYTGPPALIGQAETFGGRLWAAAGRFLRFSERGQHNVFRGTAEIVFPTEITLLKAQTDGLWVGDRNRLYFIAGHDPHEQTMAVKTDYPAIPNMTAYVDPTNMPYEPLIGAGQVIKAATRNGLVVMGPQGFLVNETSQTIEPDKPPFPFNSDYGVLGVYEDFLILTFGV